MARRRRSEPTIYDVAQAAGVSTATVSRALNGTGPLSPRTRTAVEVAVRELGYRPNEVARALKQQATRTLGLVITDTVNPFVAVIVP